MRCGGSSCRYCVQAPDSLGKARAMYNPRVKSTPMLVTLAAGVLALTAVAGAQAPAAERPKPERVPITADKAVLSKMVPGVGPPSRKIFMNGCRNGGCQIFVGQEDSRRNR